MHQNLLYFLLALLLVGCAEPDVAPSDTVYVGTDAEGAAGGVYSFSLSLDSAAAVAVDTLSLVRPSDVALSPGGQFLYVACAETDTSRTAVHAAKVDVFGRMKLLEGQKSGGATPTSVASNGTLIGVANYDGGTMSVFPVEADGSVGEISIQYFGTTGGPDARAQAVPHISCVRFMPDRASVVFADFSGDRLYIAHAGCRNDSIALRSGFAPACIAFSATGRRAYVSSGLSDAVAVFACNGSMLTQRGEVRTDSLAQQTGGSLSLSPDGKFLYASLRGAQEGIAIYSVEAKSGMLKRVGFQVTGRSPQSVNITSDGRFLLCACREDNKVQVFRRDAASGLLTDMHHDISVPRPTCVEIFK